MRQNPWQTLHLSTREYFCASRGAAQARNINHGDSGTPGFDQSGSQSYFYSQLGSHATWERTGNKHSDTLVKHSLQGG